MPSSENALSKQQEKKDIWNEVYTSASLAFGGPAQVQLLVPNPEKKAKQGAERRQIELQTQQ